ncbi:RNA polymerase sigma factor [Pseudomonas aeruginosa]|nr:RNA polymerase sigma factor [Pseudomonas aeruginosa]
MLKAAQRCYFAELP